MEIKKYRELIRNRAIALYDWRGDKSLKLPVISGVNRQEWLQNLTSPTLEIGMGSFQKFIERAIAWG
jgi:hypothetical protein